MNPNLSVSAASREFPQYLALDGITMLGEQVKRPVQLPEGEIPGFR